MSRELCDNCLVICTCDSEGNRPPTGKTMNYEHAEPHIGLGVTEYMFSDRRAYTIVDMSKSKKTLTIQRDIAKRVDNNGMSDMQEYEYTPDPNGPTRIITLRKDGRYRDKGSQSTPGSTIYSIGYRMAYHDYSF